MRYSRRLLCAAIAAAATTPLFLSGCSKPAVQAPPPPPGAQAEAEAMKPKMEEVKRANPNLPPSAVGNMAAEMMRKEKAAGGGGAR